MKSNLKSNFILSYLDNEDIKDNLTTNKEVQSVKTTHNSNTEFDIDQAKNESIKLKNLSKNKNLLFQLIKKMLNFKNWYRNSIKPLKMSNKKEAQIIKEEVKSTKSNRSDKSDKNAIEF